MDSEIPTQWFHTGVPSYHMSLKLITFKTLENPVYIVKCLLESSGKFLCLRSKRE